MWLAIHDGVSLHKKMTEAGTQTADPVVILTACLFSFVAGERKTQLATTLIATVDIANVEKLKHKTSHDSCENKAS